MGTHMNILGSVNIGNIVNDAANPSSIIRHSSSIDETASHFEQMFLSQMMQPMFEGLESDALAGDPESDDIYRSWMVEEYSKLITASGGVGIADYVKRELLALQEVKS
jgi:peptidoglycan hydrolase FlgJ